MIKTNKIVKDCFLFGKNGYFGNKIFYGINYPSFRIIQKQTYLNKDILKEEFEKYKPEFAINAVGFTGTPNVDSCEVNQDICWKLNAEFPYELAKICFEFGTKLIHLSSGCIFNGYDKIYDENDEPNFNGSFYSRSKIEAERRIILAGNSYYILRIRMPFDYKTEDTKNYLYKIFKYPKLINLPNSITWTKTVVDVIRTILDTRSMEVPYGIYHVTNPGIITPKEIISLVKWYKLDKKEWFKNLDEFHKTVVAKRSNVILDSEKGDKIFCFPNVWKAIESCI